jgi:hypothetical protein
MLKARADNNVLIKFKKIKMMELSNFKVLGTTLLVTVVGVLIALRVNQTMNQAKVSSPMASK